MTEAGFFAERKLSLKGIAMSHSPECASCPECNPEMARVLEMSTNDVPGYAKWLAERTKNAMRHMARHAFTGEGRRTPLLLRTHVHTAPTTTDNNNANGVPAAPSLANTLRRQGLRNPLQKGHKKS